ncbi:UAA transporter [Lipomyces arxii]|uniref:UAA transporter n=1 Tax=Lipomyces arxii TaxID=56418 RepID=UPI0034CFE791
MAGRLSELVHRRLTPVEKLVASTPQRGEVTSAATAYLQVGLAQWTVILGLIFGGCCSNVFTLEAIVNEDPHAGNLITFVQFLFVAVEGYIHFFTLSRPPIFLPKPSVPITRYAVIVTMFFLVSVLNNYVWKYHISVPVHIIFRSGGTVITLIVGAIVGKRYSKAQVVSVVFLTIGVITATLFDSKRKEPESEVAITEAEFVIGLAILLVAQILSAVMSQLTESTYKKYGNHWRENLFYMHFLTLPFFTPVWRSIVDEFHNLPRSSQLDLVPAPMAAFLPQITVPQNLFYLFLNAATQYVCVRGVNNLAGTFTAVTVAIVLNVRKCVSLLLSIYLFGNRLSSGTCFGALLVFSSAAWYSIESSRLREVQEKKSI